MSFVLLFPDAAKNFLFLGNNVPLVLFTFLLLHNPLCEWDFHQIIFGRISLIRFLADHLHDLSSKEGVLCLFIPLEIWKSKVYTSCCSQRDQGSSHFHCHHICLDHIQTQTYGSSKVMLKGGRVVYLVSGKIDEPRLFLFCGAIWTLLVLVTHIINCSNYYNIN